MVDDRLPLSPRPTATHLHMTDPNPPTLASLTAELAAFPEMNPAPVVRTDLSGRILLGNEAARSTFNQRALEGENWQELVGVTQAFWEAVLRGNAQHELEVTVGARELSFTYRLAPDGRSVFVFGSDVTEFRRAEERVAQYSARMSELARFPDMNPGPVLRTNHEGTIVLANTAALQLFGQGTLLGHSWKDVCPGMTDALWQTTLSADEVSRHEAQIADQAFVFAHRFDREAGLVFIYGNDVTLLRAAQEALRHSERMATLGTLSAGVAHELNNPAAAVARGAEQLRDAIILLDAAFIPLSQVCQRTDRLANLGTLTLDVRARAERPLEIEALDRSDRETEIESWLESIQVDDPWEFATALVNLHLGRADLDRLRLEWESDTATVIRWMARAQPVYALVREIGDASGRISEIVKSLKTYSFLGQAPVREVVVSEGLDSTLVMLRGKLKGGITVVRQYDPDTPRVAGYGSELNQVWTNLIDNAADAMGGKGELIVRTRAEEDRTGVVVEIEDNGPGIPEDVKPRIFDPFFTTKPVGHGTGLGLATAQSIIVRRHHGTIEVTSRPGRTCFTVRIPIQVGAKVFDETRSKDPDAVAMPGGVAEQ
jgi:signal transduction histidine kinase